MTPLLPGLTGGGESTGHRRGDVYWADPNFPTGASSTAHRCVLLRTPRLREVNVPILTLHRLSKKPGAINDCCMELESKSYRGIRESTVIDARMTMFVPVTMLRDYCFSLSDDDIAELEDCLLVALEFSSE